MSDVTEAPTQDAIAESLLPETEQLVEVPEAEQPVEAEPEAQPLEQEQQAEQEELVEDWLPSEQDRTFSEEALLRYAQRYQKDEQWLSDPLNRQLLIDKLNTDIFVRQQQRQYEQQQLEESETPPEPTREEPQPSREQHFQNLDNIVRQRTDPAVANEFYTGFMKVFGVPDAEIAKLAPQQAMPFTTLVSKYMLNLVNTYMDDMLGARIQNQVSQAYPGFGEMYERSSYAMAWAQVQNSNPEYAKLPAYGTKEFSSTLRAAAARIPGFDEMQFTGQNGKPLPPMENSVRKYSMLAQIASGQNVNPQLLQQAAAAGARNAKRAQTTRTNGNLGSGQSKAASGGAKSSKFETNDDLFDEETMALYKKEHGRL